jgi:hypothetical protein
MAFTVNNNLVLENQRSGIGYEMAVSMVLQVKKQNNYAAHIIVQVPATVVSLELLIY